MDHRIPADKEDEGSEVSEASQKENILRQCRLQAMYKGNTFPITGHNVSVDHARVTRFIIDTPRDNVMHRREDLFTYQRDKRGVHISQGESSLPVIPYRIGTRGKTSDSFPSDKSSSIGLRDNDVEERLTRFYFPNDGSLPRLNRHHQHYHYNIYNSKTSSKTRSRHIQPLLHLCNHLELSKVRLTSENNGGLFITDDPKLTISQKINLTERDQKGAEKTTMVPLSERLSRTNMKAKTFFGVPVKRSVSSTDIQKPLELAESNADDDSICVDLPSDRIGPTTKHKSMEDTPRTLADLINRNSYDKYRNLTNKRQRLAERTFLRMKPFSNDSISAREVDQELYEKFNTRLIDGLSYDTFARTRRLVPDQELTNGDKKRSKEQMSSDFSDRLSPVSKEDSQIKKVDSVSGKSLKHSKLRIVLTNNRAEL